MSVIESNYTEQKSISHGFLDGLAPWMAQNNNGGTVSTHTTGGGHAELATGTAAANDYARIDIGTLSPTGQSGMDAVGVRCVFALDSGAATKNACTTQFGWLETSTPQRIYHQPNHGTESERANLRVSSASADTYHPTRDCLPVDTVTTELLWDTAADEIIHRYQDAFAQRVTSADTTIPDPSLGHSFKIQIGTSDTATDRVMYLYEVELSYYTRDRQ